MKKNTIFFIIAVMAILSCIPGCKKANTDGDNCAQIQQVKIIGAKSSYDVGDTIELSTSIVPLALYTWYTPADPNPSSSSNTISIFPCSKFDQGWYYLNISYPDCASHNDSVYLPVINKPTTAPCNPTNNTVSFSAIPNISFSSITWAWDPNSNCRSLYGYYADGYPDFDIYFNFYWDTIEPEDGAYSISNTISFDDNNPYSVFIASTYSSVYFEAGPGTVYVSHVNGKLRVTFCNLSLSGDLGGPSYTTTATGQLTAP